MTISYRYGTCEDREAIYQLLLGFIDEVKDVWGLYDHEPDAVRKAIDMVAGFNMLLLAFDEDHLVGILGLIPSCWWWHSSQGPIEDIWFYVDPSRRKSVIARNLVKWACNIADGMGRDLKLSQTTGTDIDRKVKFFTRHGFNHLGGIFMRFNRRS